MPKSTFEFRQSQEVVVELDSENIASLLAEAPADEMVEILAFFTCKMTRLEWEAQSLSMKHSNAVGPASKENIVTFFKTFIEMMEDE